MTQKKRHVVLIMLAAGLAAACGGSGTQEETRPLTASATARPEAEILPTERPSTSDLVVTPTGASPGGKVIADERGGHENQVTATPADTGLLAQLFGHDRLLAILAQDIPGFAGMYLGRDQVTLNINVTDPSRTRLEDVKASLARVFPDEPRFQSYALELHQVEYGFLELAAWYIPLRQRVDGHAEVVSTSIGERENRIRIGVLNAETQAWVMARSQELSIPPSAITVEVTGPFEPS